MPNLRYTTLGVPFIAGFLVFFGSCYAETNLGSVPVGDICVLNEDCLGHPEKTVCYTSETDSRCWCRHDHVPIETAGETSCEPIRNEIGEECVDREQCTSGVPGEWSDCLSSTNSSLGGVCGCMNGSSHQEGQHKCLRNADHVGDPCETLEQCTAALGDFSRCRDNVCECIPGLSFSGFNGMKCLLIMNVIGGPCEISEQCRLGRPGNWSECAAGDCQCQDNAILEPGKHVCLRKAELVGDECQIDEQCTANLGNLTECSGVDGRCLCKNGTPPGGNTCVEDVQNELGGNCTESSQCQRGEPGELSICENEVCACSPEATNERGENVCRRKALFVGDECLRNAQCKANLGELSECLLGEGCACTPRYGVPSLAEDRCLAVINFIGGECEEKQQCTSGVPGPHSDCLDSPIIPGMKICNCTNGAANEPGRHECIKEVVLIGSPCEYDYQCAGEPGTSSVCSKSGVCGCLGSYIPTSQNDNCLPIINRIGQSCATSQQCQLGVPGELSECSSDEGVCDCSIAGAHEPGENVCHSITALSGPCQVNVQCTGSLGEYSQCVAGRCECTRNASPDLPRKKCVLNNNGP